MPLRFHFRLPNGGETDDTTRAQIDTSLSSGLPDLEAQTRFCRAAEDAGVDSLLIDFSPHKPDPMLLAAALGLATKKIRFILAHRSGIVAPVALVQQLNTLSALIDGRFSLNIVAGHTPADNRSFGDFLAHDERYARTEELLQIAHALWRGEGPLDFQGRYYAVERAALNTPFVCSAGRRSPEILIAGSSEAARLLALRQGTCWMQFADAPDRLAPRVGPARQAGLDIGLRLSFIARKTRAEALEAAAALVEHQAGDAARGTEQRFVRNSDSVSMIAQYTLAETEWLTPVLWTGAIRSHGATALALVGSYEEVAQALWEYGALGATQFILTGWPRLGSVRSFGEEILPLIRERERAAQSGLSAARASRPGPPSAPGLAGGAAATRPPAPGGPEDRR